MIKTTEFPTRAKQKITAWTRISSLARPSSRVGGASVELWSSSVVLSIILSDHTKKIHSWGSHLFPFFKQKHQQDFFLRYSFSFLCCKLCLSSYNIGAICLFWMIACRAIFINHTLNNRQRKHSCLLQFLLKMTAVCQKFSLDWDIIQSRLCHFSLYNGCCLTSSWRWAVILILSWLPVWTIHSAKTTFLDNIHDINQNIPRNQSASLLVITY